MKKVPPSSLRECGTFLRGVIDGKQKARFMLFEHAGVSAQDFLRDRHENKAKRMRKILTGAFIFFGVFRYREAKLQNICGGVFWCAPFPVFGFMV